MKVMQKNQHITEQSGCILNVLCAIDTSLILLNTSWNMLNPKRIKGYSLFLVNK